MKNPARKINSITTRSFISRSIENLPPINYNNNIHGGFFFAPPHNPLSFSYPPPSSPSVSNPHQHNYCQKHAHAQPPLLPLPISKPHHNSLSSRSRGLCCPPTATRKTNRLRDQSLTPKIPKQPNTKKIEEAKKESLIVESTVPLGPDPKDLPRDVSKVLSSSVTVSGNDVISNTVLLEDFEKFSGSVFTLSPHPSSLPLPKFSMRPKLSCTAEAAGIDAGATDNLRRLLRLW